MSLSPNTKEKSRFCYLQKRAQWYLLAVACVSVLIYLAPFAARQYWFCDVLSHFIVQMCVGSVVMCAICLALRLYKHAIAHTVLACLFAIQLLPLWFGGSEQTDTSPLLTISMHNVLTTNTQYEDIRTETVTDIALFLEVDKTWVAELQELKKDYPYSIEHPRSDNFGMALYSRLPVLTHSIEYFSTDHVPTIVCTVQTAEAVVTIIGVHPVPPVGQDGLRNRNHYLENLAIYVQGCSSPTIVLGDFNTTIWSPCFTDFVEATLLHNSATGHGWGPTWKADYWPLAIPIDHIVCSQDLSVQNFSIGETHGSDHNQLHAELQLIQ